MAGSGDSSRADAASGDCWALEGTEGVSALAARAGPSDSAPMPWIAQGVDERGFLIQIQEGFASTPLSALACMGLEIYSLIPDYRDRCPLCSGRNCAVRHGLYHRRVVDENGCTYDRFPVPRFKCRRRGGPSSKGITFSVLPVDLISRFRSSLPLMTRILSLFLREASIARTLDALASSSSSALATWFPEPSTVHRLIRLGSKAESKLRFGPAASERIGTGSDLRSRTRRLLYLLGPPGRAAPRVLGFHRKYFPDLLF